MRLVAGEGAAVPIAAAGIPAVEIAERREGLADCAGLKV